MYTIRAAQWTLLLRAFRLYWRLFFCRVRKERHTRVHEILFVLPRVRPSVRPSVPRGRRSRSVKLTLLRPRPSVTTRTCALLVRATRVIRYAYVVASLLFVVRKRVSGFRVRRAADVVATASAEYAKPARACFAPNRAILGRPATCLRNGRKRLYATPTVNMKFVVSGSVRVPSLCAQRFACVAWRSDGTFMSKGFVARA